MAPVLRTACAKVRQNYWWFAEPACCEEVSIKCQLNFRTLQAVNTYTRYCKKVHRPLVNIAPRRLQKCREGNASKPIQMRRRPPGSDRTIYVALTRERIRTTNRRLWRRVSDEPRKLSAVFVLRKKFCETLIFVRVGIDDPVIEVAQPLNPAVHMFPVTIEDETSRQYQNGSLIRSLIGERVDEMSIYREKAIQLPENWSRRLPLSARSRWSRAADNFD
jgi:hypothetical protein